MAKRLAIPSKEIQLVIVGPRDSFKASRIQRLSLNTDIPSTDIDELGNSTHAGQTKDLPAVTLAFSAFDVSVKVFSALTGVDPTAWVLNTGVDISELGEIDALLYVKSDTAATYAKSGSARRLQIRDFTFSYSVDGESTEDYNAIGSEKRWLKYDAIVDKLTGAGPYTLSETPIALNNGNKAISCILDGVYLTETQAVLAEGEYKIVGQTLTMKEALVNQVQIVYHANATNPWTDVSDSLPPAAIKGKDVDIKILAENIDRVQSVTINGNLNATAVNEMGTRNVIGYQRQVPTVDGTITVLDTDTELIALLSYGVTTSGVEWQPGEGCSTTPLTLTVELVDPCDTSSPYEVLKTVYIPSIIIVGDSYTANVNNNVSQVFNFKSEFGTCVVYSGAKTA
jgi:hypothetical protein